MTASVRRYAGQDLGPLAFESQISVLLRIAWRNAFSSRVMKSHFSRQKARFAFDPERLLQHYGWLITEPVVPPCDLEHAGTFLALSFRFCPLCLEAGYHSYLHQCHDFERCPVHDIPFSERCHCCAAATPQLNDFESMFDKPYHCARCREPLCGAPPQLDAHLDFRSAFDSAILRLMPYQRWWEDGEERRTLALAMVHPHDVGLQSTWCNQARFLRALATQFPAHLDCLGAAPYDRRSVTTLEWKQCVPLACIDELFRPRTNWKTRVKIPTAVYRCTLRLLENWIDGEVRSEMNGKAHPMEPTYAFLTHNARCERALSLMRLQLESGYSGSTEQLPSRGAILKDCPKIEISTYSGRTSRLGWRAIFLAIFATWYRLTARTAQQELQKAAKYLHGDAGLIFFRSSTLVRVGEKWSAYAAFNPDEAMYRGAVAFLRIPGMPLNPWKKERLGDAYRCSRKPSKFVC